MKKAIHRIFTVVLMLCICLGAMSYLFFDAAQIECKIDADRHIAANGNLEVLELPLAEFNTADEQGEIWYRGELYDISSVAVHDGIAYVTVYHDTEEETLVNNVNNSIDSSTGVYAGATDHFSVHKIHAVDNDKIAFAVSEYHRLPVNIVSTSDFYYGVTHFSFLFSSVIKPPPRFVLV